LGTWTNRIENYINDGEGSDNYQVEQAKIAIARGSLIGVLSGNSLQRNLLPHPYSDFVYAIIIEEYGFIGGFTILMLYMILLYRSVKIASKSPGSFGAFLVIGLSFSLVFQALINMGVAVNLLPVTGQPLPLVSMGGSSLIHTSLAIGIILSVSRKVDEQEELEAETIEE
jgi:cell division protein FtsW